MGLFGSSGGYQNVQDRQAVDTLKGTETPDINSMMLHLQELVQQGEITPEEAQTYLQQSSDMNNISLDPKYKQAQLDALSSLQDIGQNKGITSMDQAQLNDIQSQEDTHARGAREAILQNAQARGVGGSGAELLSQMVNEQGAAGRASQEGFNVAANAQQRALQALQDAGKQGAQMQATEFGEKAQVANANDSINRFNAANQQNQENMNVNARNQAQATNLANQQNISNQNTGLANSEQQYNKQLAQTDFENNMKKNQAVAGALNKTGANQQAQQNTNDQVGRQLIGMGLGAAAAFSDEKLKKNVEKFDPSDFLDNLTSYKYNYKSPKHGEGKQVGVMAQDVEKSLPQMVENTPEGKVVDYNKAGGPLFASVADLHKRLKKIEGRK